MTSGLFAQHYTSPAAIKDAVDDHGMNAEPHETIGMRLSSDKRQDNFGGYNPYSTISLREQIGEHCQLKLPEQTPAKPHLVATRSKDFAR